MEVARFSFQVYKPVVEQGDTCGLGVLKLDVAVDFEKVLRVVVIAGTRKCEDPYLGDW